jgi:hypothetical protein
VEGLDWVVDDIAGRLYYSLDNHHRLAASTTNHRDLIVASS